MSTKSNHLWIEFVRLFSRYLSGELSPEAYETAWAKVLKDCDVTREEFSERHCSNAI